MMPLIVSKVSRPLKSALWIRLMFLCLCLGFPTPGAYSFSLRSHCFRSTAPTLRAPGAFALRSEASLRPPLQAHFASPQEGFRLDLDSRYFRNQSLRGGPGTVARLQPAGHHRAAHRGAQSRAQRGGVLHEAVFCDRGGVSVGALVFNLLSLYQKALNPHAPCRQPATLRSAVFLGGPPWCLSDANQCCTFHRPGSVLRNIIPSWRPF